MSAASLLGLSVGLAAGIAAGLLAAPMRGAEMRRSLRSRADGALDRGRTLLGEGRRGFRRRDASSSATPGTAPLSAAFGEIAQMHAGNDLTPFREARS